MNIQKIISKFSYCLEHDKSLLKKFKSFRGTAEDDFNYFNSLYKDITLNKIQFCSFISSLHGLTINQIIDYQNKCDQVFYELGIKYRES